MHVGLTAATGQTVRSHKTLAWSFGNTNFSLSDMLITSNLPSLTLWSNRFHDLKSQALGD